MEGNAVDLEEQIKDILEKLHANPDLQNFIKRLQDATKTFQVDRCIPRVKSIASAQRTARVKKFQSLDDANDYIGIAFVVKDETQIYDIAKNLKTVFPNSGSIDFLNEEFVYSPLCYIKKVPPLSYNIITREKVGQQENVPVEIRICTKESFLSNQAVHDTVYKNDELDMPIGEKIKLLCVSQHIVYKLAMLGIRENLSAEERQKHEKELKEVLDNNKAFLGQYADVFESVITDYAMSVYEYEHYKELDKLTLDERKKRLNNARNKYRQMYAQSGHSELDFVERANKPVQELIKINVSSLDEGLEPAE